MCESNTIQEKVDAGRPSYCSKDCILAQCANSDKLEKGTMCPVQAGGG